ncbi:MAG: hypothetical protein N3B21_00335 [Clostridia bacterium]|nr:hypothetical protein [Clostridia bacterium]
MKLTDLAIIFVIISLPFNLMFGLKIDNVKYSSMRKIELNRILDTATEDGVSKLIEMGEDKKVIINKEQAVQAFFNSLYVSFDITDSKPAQRKINGYVPVIVIADYDGYHVLSNETYTHSGGYTEIKQVWKPKKMYSYADSRFVYSFTLDSFVTVYDSTTGEFHKGDYHDFKSQLPASSIIQNDTTFDEIRRRTIVECLKNDINYYINKHNDIALQYGLTYHFTLPTIKDEDWYKTVDDISMLVFFQGVPIGTGGERFNNFNLGGARIVKTPKYYVETNPATGIKYYHRENCTIPAAKDTIMNSRMECAKNGYLPCSVCNP